MTRYERIMQDIDEGLTDEQLAEKYYSKTAMRSPKSRKEALKCMHVYRLAHDKMNARLSAPGMRVGAPIWYGRTIEDFLKDLRGRWRR